ncbi:hypothetical protein Emag_002164 [Eimeria magna]
MQNTLLTFGFLVAASLAVCASSAETIQGTEDPKENGEPDSGGQLKPSPPAKEEEEEAPIGSGSNVMEKTLHSDINPLREAAGLTAFQKQRILPLTEDSREVSGGDEVSKESEFFKSVCQRTQLTPRDNNAPAETDATYALHTQTGNTASCSAAVNYWKGAIASFESLPPKYDSEAEVYSDRRNVSFVALFNPQPNAKIDCAYITCAKKNESSLETEDGDADEPDEPIIAPGTRARSVRTTPLRKATRGKLVKDTHVLICVTQPVALREDTNPFT